MTNSGSKKPLELTWWKYSLLRRIAMDGVRLEESEIGVLQGRGWTDDKGRVVTSKGEIAMQDYEEQWNGPLKELRSEDPLIALFG